ncbi:MAG: PQQ-binding-like beta-propeller repeat protein [Ignavibacteriales bacterium]|nr:PQQ-binding-like beta-propeller repeat protein [Ignavibacteriales bacterium]
MKLLIKNIFAALLMYACSQPLVLKNMSAGENGYLMYGKNPGRTFYENISITEYLQPLWEAETHGSQNFSSVILFGNYLFVSDLSGRIYVFDKTNGKQVGYEKYSGSISIAPVIYKLRIFFIVNDYDEKFSTIYQFDFITGKILGEDKINGGVNNEMLLLEDGIIVVTDFGEVIKYNFACMREWSVNTKTTSLSSPASDGKIILFGNQKGEVTGVSKDDGAILFKEKVSGAIEGGVTVDGGTLFFCDIKGKLYSFDLSTRKTNWVLDTGYKIISTPVFDNQKIFTGNLSGNIYCVEKSSGKKIWQTKTDGVINTTPLLTNSFLVQPDYNKKVYMINQSNGEIVKTYEYERRTKLTPVYLEGALYLGSDRGIVHAYKTFNQN